MSTFLDIALKAADAAEAVTLDYYQGNLQVSLKADRSPVTIADKEAEAAIIATIRDSFPDHAFFGEETGKTGQSDYRWIIDPIDGTKNYIAGIPLWGTLIALTYKGEVVVGVSRCPVLKETVYAERGGGAFLNGKPIHVSNCARVADAMVSFGSIYCFTQRGLEQQLLALLRDARRHRAFGDLWPIQLAAAGRLDIVVEGALHAYDIAPFAVIFEEAGGKLTDLNGRPFHDEITSVVATNGELHDEVLRYFQ